MCAHFAIHHQTESPAYYDIIIDREQAVSIFRIDHLDILDFLDGNEVMAEEIDPAGAGRALSGGMQTGQGKGTVRLFDEGSCAIELWSLPVNIIQVASRQLNGTLHILKLAEGYSLRYLRSRLKRPPLR